MLGVQSFKMFGSGLDAQVWYISSRHLVTGGRGPGQGARAGPGRWVDSPLVVVRDPVPADPLGVLGVFFLTVHAFRGVGCRGRRVWGLQFRSGEKVSGLRAGSS